jgi:hypothetical protein
MKMNSKNVRLILIAGLAFCVLAFFGITLYGLSVLSKKSQDLANLKTQSQSADNQLVNLVQAKKDIEKYSYFKSIASSVIPTDKNQAQAVLEINKIADDAGISIQSITFPASTLPASTIGGAAAAPTASQNAAAAGATKTALTQAKPVPGIPGLYSLQLTITPDTGKDVAQNKQVTYSKMLDFLKRIENNRHTAQISQVSIQPASDSQTISFSLVINIFIKP